MFFITEGKAALHMDASDPAKQTPPPIIELTAGTMFGEMSLLKDIPSMGHVIALDVSEAFYLSCEAFDAIYKEHEEFAEKIRIVVKQRQAANDARKTRAANAAYSTDSPLRSGEKGGNVAAARLYRMMTATSISTSRFRIDPAIDPEESAHATSSGIPSL